MASAGRHGNPNPAVNKLVDRGALSLGELGHQGAMRERPVADPGDAGASGFFVPRLADSRQVERVVREVPLPLNLIAFPGAPPKAEWAAAGVARISHGPFPHRALMEQLTEAARAAIG